MNGNEHVPILGQRPRVGVQPMALMRSLDDNGTAPAQAVVQGPDGQQVGILGRTQYIDASELVEMIRKVVAAEIHKALSSMVRPK
mgnify:CR=1 FL=1